MAGNLVTRTSIVDCASIHFIDQKTGQRVRKRVLAGSVVMQQNDILTIFINDLIDEAEGFI